MNPELCTVELWAQLFGQIFGMGLGFGIFGGIVIGLMLFEIAHAFIHFVKLINHKHD